MPTPSPSSSLPPSCEWQMECGPSAQRWADTHHCPYTPAARTHSPAGGWGGGRPLHPGERGHNLVNTQPVSTTALALFLAPQIPPQIPPQRAETFLLYSLSLCFQAAFPSFIHRELIFADTQNSPWIAHVSQNL